MNFPSRATPRNPRFVSSAYESDFAKCRITVRQAFMLSLGKAPETPLGDVAHPVLLEAFNRVTPALSPRHSVPLTLRMVAALAGDPQRQHGGDTTLAVRLLARSALHCAALAPDRLGVGANELKRELEDWVLRPEPLDDLRRRRIRAAADLAQTEPVIDVTSRKGEAANSGRWAMIAAARAIEAPQEALDGVSVEAAIADAVSAVRNVRRSGRDAALVDYFEDLVEEFDRATGSRSPRSLDEERLAVELVNRGAR